MAEGQQIVQIRTYKNKFNGKETKIQQCRAWHLE